MKSSSEGYVPGNTHKHHIFGTRTSSLMSTSQLLQRFENMHRLGAHKITDSLKK